MNTEGPVQSAGPSSCAGAAQFPAASGVLLSHPKVGFDHFFGYNCQRRAHSYFPTGLCRDDQRFHLPGAWLRAGIQPDGITTNASRAGSEVAVG